MDTNNYKVLLLILVAYLLVGTGCASPLKTTEERVQLEPTTTAYIGIPQTSPPLIQSENESVEEFVARIAVTKINYNTPALIALTKVKSQENLYMGVSIEKPDIQKCWFYQDRSMTLCQEGDLESNFSSQSLPTLYLAIASSTDTQALYLIDHYYWKSKQDTVDGYRLVIDLVEDKWVENSLTQVY